MLRHLVVVFASLLLLTACAAPNATPNANNNPSANPGSSASPGASTGVGVNGDIYATKQTYIAFLDCAAKKDATAATMAGIFKTALNAYTDAQWAQAKIVVQATHKSFIDTYGAGCM